MSLNELLSAYVRERIPKKATRTHYERVIRIFCQDTGMAVTDQIGEIGKEMVLGWRDLVLERASRATWNNYCRHMRSLWRFGTEASLLEAAEDPWQKMNVKVLVTRKKTVDLDNIGTCIKALEAEQLPLKPGWFWVIALRIYYKTGIRRKQLVRLRPRDISFNDRVIRLTAQNAKNGHEREFPMDDSTEGALKSLFDAYRANGLHLGYDDQLFNVTRFSKRYAGTEMTEEQVSQAFKRISKATGIQISAHRLRHTFGTTLAPHVSDVKTLQILLGHESIVSTMQYIHPDMNRQRNVIAHLPNI